MKIFLASLLLLAACGRPPEPTFRDAVEVLCFSYCEKRAECEGFEPACLASCTASLCADSAACDETYDRDWDAVEVCRTATASQDCGSTIRFAPCGGL